MSFTRQKRVYVNDVNEFNMYLRIAKADRIIKLGAYESGEIGCIAYLNDKLISTELTMKLSGKAITYIFNKDCRKNMQEISGMDAYIQLARSFNNATGYPIPIYDEPELCGSAVAVLGYRTEISDKQRVYAYSYDQNSSYGWAMTQPMPDTRKAAGYSTYVKKGQIGFIVDEISPIPGFVSAGEVGLQIVREGGGAEVVFDLMESPFKRFAELWYSRKLKPETKNKAKQMLCYSVGYLQRKNPYLRAAIIGYANEYIRSLVDDNTIYVNTDCLISTEIRTDLPIGKGLGEFKMDHQGMFANDGFNYQWDLELPTYRGTPRTWFKEGWDILKDPLPTNQNIYELNSITLQMEAKKYERLS